MDVIEPNRKYVSACTEFVKWIEGSSRVRARIGQDILVKIIHGMIHEGVQE
jgi:hypothetical protein